MKKMMGLKNQTQAEVEYRALSDWLSTINVDAVTSLDEAGYELLTVHSIGLNGEYRKSLASTNPIESLIGIIKKKTNNVTNWAPHPMTKKKVPRDKALRWVATAIQTHRKKMRRLRGGKAQIDFFISKLNNVDTEKMTA